MTKDKTFRKTLILVTVLTAFFIFTFGCTNHRQHSPATEQRFTDIEKWISIFEDPSRDEWQKPAEVVKNMNLKPGDVVADIGAGTGYFTRRFAVAVAPDGKALGLDIEKSMVDHMNKQAKELGIDNYEARVVKTNDPELAPDSVDVVFLCNTYHHIADRVEYFRKVSKSLKSGGRVIIVDFYKDTDFGPPRDHKLAKKVVLEEMGQAGYRLHKDLDILPQQYYLEYILN